MFRTRDFVLLFTTIVFLLTAIGATLFAQIQPRSQHNTTSLLPAHGTTDTYGAFVAEKDTVSYAERLEAMRAKIAASGDVVISNVVEEIVQEPAPVSTSTSTQDPVNEPLYCSKFSSHIDQWPLGGVVIEEVEGGRLVYTETESVVVSGTSSEIVISQNILAQLPVRSAPSPTQHCLMSDVIGIAKDGSLIRNTEVGLYGVFESETLIGYSLDGFPIYGMSNESTDNCGGIMTPAGYHYVLSSDRTTILNCFAAEPVQL